MSPSWLVTSCAARVSLAWLVLTAGAYTAPVPTLYAMTPPVADSAASAAAATPQEAPDPRLSVEERRLMAYQAQAEGDVVGALGYFGSLHFAGEIDAEAAVRYARLLSELGRFSEAVEVLEPFGDDPAVVSLLERRALRADRNPTVGAVEENDTGPTGENASALIPGITVVIDNSGQSSGRAPDLLSRLQPSPIEVPPVRAHHAVAAEEETRADVREESGEMPLYDRSSLESVGGGGLNGSEVRHLMARASGSVRPTGGALEVRVDVARNQLSQADYVRQMTMMQARADSLLTGALGRIGVGGLASFEDAGPTLVGGFGSAELRPAGRTLLGVEVSYVPAWHLDRRTDPLHAIRLRDVSLMDPGLSAFTVRGEAAVRWGSTGEIFTSGGVFRFTDENERTFAYGHIRIPLRSGTFSLAVEPNIYGEQSLVDQADGFFHPLEYGRVGLRAWVGVRFGQLAMSLEGNPHWFGYPGISGIGLSGSVLTSLSVGPFDLLGDLLFYDQAVDSFIWALLGVRVPIT